MLKKKNTVESKNDMYVSHHPKVYILAACILDQKRENKQTMNKKLSH